MSAKIEGVDTQDFEDRTVGLVTSYYPDLDATRLPIALDTLKNYRDADIPIVMVDASPEAEVRARFRELGAIVLHAPDLGLATSAIAGAEFIRANGGDRIIKHEPEKTLIPKFADVINEALDVNEAVVIGRTPEAIATLPTTQRETEAIGGRLMAEHLGIPADSLSGGRAFARTGTDELINYDHGKWGDNWMHLHIPIIDSIRKGHKVGGVRVPLIHPEQMTQEEEGDPSFDNKRAMQLQLHTDLINRYLKENPSYKELVEQVKKKAQ